MNKEQAVRAAIGQIEKYISVARGDALGDSDYDEGFRSALNDIDLFIQNMDIDYRVDLCSDMIDLLNYLSEPVYTEESVLHDELFVAFTKYAKSIGLGVIYDTKSQRYTLVHRTKPISLDLTTAELEYLYDAVNIAKDEAMQTHNYGYSEVIDSVIDKVYETIKEV